MFYPPKSRRSLSFFSHMQTWASLISGLVNLYPRFVPNFSEDLRPPQYFLRNYKSYIPTLSW